jgi:Flp pilus assembly protein TadD
MRSKVSIVVIGLSLALSIMLASVSIATAQTAVPRATAGARAKAATQPADQVCDATADYFLGMEDYGEAITTHRRVLAAHPEDALAHYHLGFAYGMIGDRQRELVEYRKAAALSLHDWDLYLNLGRALLESGDLTGAASALNTAVTLDPKRPEAHFNLGLVYERRGMLAAARDELQTSLRLDPRQPDALNMMGLIMRKNVITHALVKYGMPLLIPSPILSQPGLIWQSLIASRQRPKTTLQPTAVLCEPHSLSTPIEKASESIAA